MTAGPAAPAPPPAASWVLLPLAWCVWLLAFLVPSLLITPHLETLRPWLTADTAPAAVVAAAAFFLTAIWPFWPALAAPVTGIRGRAAARWFLVSLVEAVMLLALAAPFVVVAWSVAGKTLDPAWLLLVSAPVVAIGLTFRLVVAALAGRGVRWIMLAAVLFACGSLPLAYALSEVFGAAASTPVNSWAGMCLMAGVVESVTNGREAASWNDVTGIIAACLWLPMVWGGLLLAELSFRLHRERRRREET